MEPLADRTKALADRLRLNTLGALELYTLYLGERLGLYRALADDEPVTSSELAERTGAFERYVREWLEQHAASGLLDVDDPAAEPLACRYRMPPEHVPVLADPDHLLYDAYKGVDIVRAARPLPDLVDAFRTGGAPPPLSWDPEGRAEFNRAIYLNLLGTEWLPAIPTSIVVCAPNRRRGSPTSPAAPAGRASRWLVRTPRSRCTGSTSTRT
jgi:hypothetical protein